MGPSRRISLNSSPRRPGHRHSCGARPKSPDTSGVGSSPLRMMRRSSGPISPRPTVSGPSSGVRKSGTDYLNSATEQGGPLEVDEISDAVDKIIRQKMDAAWAHVCDRFNIPYDAKVQPSRSPVARFVSPRVRSRRLSAPSVTASSNSSTHLDHALQRAMTAVPFGLVVNSPAKEVSGNPSQQPVGSTDHLNYHTPAMPNRHNCTEPMQGKNTTGSRAQLFTSNAILLK